jgi:hypothetical protein
MNFLGSFLDAESGNYGKNMGIALGNFQGNFFGPSAANSQTLVKCSQMLEEMKIQTKSLGKRNAIKVMETPRTENSKNIPPRNKGQIPKADILSPSDNLEELMN